MLVWAFPSFIFLNFFHLLCESKVATSVRNEMSARVTGSASPAPRGVFVHLRQCVCLVVVILLAVTAAMLQRGMLDPPPLLSTNVHPLESGAERKPRPAVAGDDTRSGPLMETPVTAITIVTGKRTMRKRFNATTLRYDYRRTKMESLLGQMSGHVCELAMIFSGHCDGILTGDSTLVECLRRLGTSAALTLLPKRCLMSVELPALLDEADGVTLVPVPADVAFGHRKSQRWGKDGRGGIIPPAVETPPAPNPLTSQQILPERPPQYMSPHRRPPSAYGKPKVCRNGAKIHPIGFAVPSNYIRSSVAEEKLFDFLPYNPRNFPPGGAKRQPYKLSPNDEWFSRVLHERSYYAFTHKRGGWDCMRHYEILASGAVPFFPDILQCPHYSLTALPKELIFEAMKLLPHIGYVTPGTRPIRTPFVKQELHRSVNVNFLELGSFDRSALDAERYFQLAERILNHTQHFLSTKSLAAHILRVVGLEEPTRVLLIGRWAADYMHLSIEHGLCDLGISTLSLGNLGGLWVRGFNGTFTSERAMEEYRQMVLKSHTSVGKGWLYGFHLDPRVVDVSTASKNDTGVSRRIRGNAQSNEFDLVVYSYLEEEPIHTLHYWRDVEVGFPDKRLRVFVHHNDDVGDQMSATMEAAEHGWVFKREMSDVPC